MNEKKQMNARLGQMQLHDGSRQLMNSTTLMDPLFPGHSFFGGWLCMCVCQNLKNKRE